MTLITPQEAQTLLGIQDDLEGRLPLLLDAATVLIEEHLNRRLLKEAHTQQCVGGGQLLLQLHLELFEGRPGGRVDVDQDEEAIELGRAGHVALGGGGAGGGELLAEAVPVVDPLDTFAVAAHERRGEVLAVHARGVDPVREQRAGRVVLATLDPPAGLATLDARLRPPERKRVAST